ncbi:Translation initiation factor eIF4e [Balamuthia mandrillaris]
MQDQEQTPTEEVAPSGIDLSIKHPLEFEWTFWYDKRRLLPKGGRVRGERQMFESNLQEIGTFGSVEDFWRYYNHMVKPSELENNANYHLFKQGVKPMWEDPANANGGKWIVQVKRSPQKTDQYWEDLVLAMIGETLEGGDEICGAVMSKRKAGDKIALWNRSSDEDKIMDLGRKLKLSLGIKEKMIYQNHADSMRSGASYSNPDRYILT